MTKTAGDEMVAMAWHYMQGHEKQRQALGNIYSELKTIYANNELPTDVSVKVLELMTLIQDTLYEA